MSPAELSSIKWEQDGEMSAQDTWILVKKLTKVEEQGKASNLLTDIEAQPFKMLNRR